MKNILIHITLLFAVTFIHGNSYAATDSIPACINTMKIATETSVTEYEYKGQRWFVFTKTVPPAEPNNSDKMITTKFYNADCKIVCSWTKGGIAALNRVIPDTIEKSMIKRLLQPKETVIYNASDTVLGDTIRRVAKTLNARYIQQYDYNGKAVYFLAQISLPSYELVKKGISTTEENYYDSDGKWVATFRRATAGMFMRSQRWEPSSFVPSKLVSTKSRWIKKNDTYVFESQNIPGNKN